MPTTTATDEDFASKVLEADIPVVVDFWAEWCGPCKQIAPALEELSGEFEGRVKIVKVDVDNSPDSPASFGVRSIPALFIFKDGEVVSSKAGATSTADLRGWIAEAVETADKTPA